MPASWRTFTHAARHCSSVPYCCSNSASVSPCMIARIAPIPRSPESILHRFRGGRKGGDWLPGSYSTDLRERVLVAVEAGEPADVVAEQFVVGRSSVYRWIAAARDEGRRAPKRIGGGPKPIIRDEIEAVLCRLLEENNHLTLEECRDRLAKATGVRVNPWTIGRALRRLDWT